MTNVDDSQAQPQEDRFAFVNELGELDTLVGVWSRNNLGPDVLDVTEGTIRTALKALQQAVPEPVLVQDGKITELGAELVEQFINRLDEKGNKAVAAQWIEELKAELQGKDFYQEWTKQTQTTSRFGSVDFLREEANRAKEKSTALATLSKEALGAMKAQLLELKTVHSSIKDKAQERAFNEGFEEEMSLLTQKLAGRIKARQAFSEALEEDQDLEGLL